MSCHATFCVCGHTSPLGALTVIFFGLQHEVDSEERSVKAMLDISTRMRQAAWNLMRKLRRIPLPSHPVTTANGASSDHHHTMARVWLVLAFRSQLHALCVTGDMLDTEDVGVVTHDTIWQAVGQCEWKLARLLDSVVSRDYEHVNVMSLLPSDLNIMVKTEADVLKKQAADEAAAGKEEMYAAAEVRMWKFVSPPREVSDLTVLWMDSPG